MAKSAGIAVQQSRFALLKLEGSDDEPDDVSSKQSYKGSKGGQQSTNAKKKNKKKKKEGGENAELRNLAFGPSTGKGKGNKSKGGGDSAVIPDKQWEQWKKMDDEYTADTYQRDLQQALLQSKLDFEEHKEKVDTGKDSEENGKGGKKKKKNKPAPMSLEQFNQIDINSTKPKPRRKSNSDDSEELPEVEVPETKLKPVAEPDPKFFEKVTKDASRIIQKEKIQEQYQKHYIVENARVQQFKDDLSKKDREIAMLRLSHEKLQEELKTVKKRNQQLCFIISQGEMKDKKTVLLELEELKALRDELRDEVSVITVDLAKERTKVHALKDEVYKLKDAKHGGK